jgi:glyoxylate reductase
MKPRVYVTRRLADVILDRISEYATVAVYDREDEPVPRQELLSAVEGVSGILSMLTDTMDAEVFSAAGPQLKVVANMAVGYDNISLKDAERFGVVVTNTPDVLTDTTADLVFALLLATARRLVEAEAYLRHGQWRTWSPSLLTGMDIHAATIGIIGMGRIAEAVLRRARGFDMHVLYYSRTRRPDLEQKYGCKFVSLDALLSTADFVVPLVPLSNETRGLIGKRELAQMKSTAVLINASRGPIVDQRALYNALRTRKIWAAGLDVMEREPIEPDDPLLTLDNVVLLPHIGSATIATRMRMASVAMDNLLEGVLGGNPPNRIL